MSALSHRAIQICCERAAIPVKEHGRNRGPEIDRYHEQVGLRKEGAYPWCTSGLYDAFLQASRELGVRNPFPKTAKAVRVWEALYGRCYEPDPAPGRVYVLDHGRPGNLLTQWKNSRYTDDGHIGLVVATNNGPTPVEVELPDIVAVLLGVPMPSHRYMLPPGEVLEVSANTNAAGSREGDRWAVHRGTPEISHGGILLGYLDLDRA